MIVKWDRHYPIGFWAFFHKHAERAERITKQENARLRRAEILEPVDKNFDDALDILAGIKEVV